MEVRGLQPKRQKTFARKHLVIVESPAKAQTIEKYLGTQYVVRASMGHVIDLPKSRLAIDIEHDFQPEYITVRGRAQCLKELRTLSKQSLQVFLASDRDREGEAIAYHLAQSIQAYCDTPIKRIVFNEITPHAIRAAIGHPVPIDTAKVNAQKARRVLDRLVGYHLCPLLWHKVKNGLSAGRVQSVALRLICEREVEVKRFVPEEYWTVEGTFEKDKKSFSALLILIQGKKAVFKSKQEATSAIGLFSQSEARVSQIRSFEKNVRPKQPFTTSTLQQCAANRLGFTSRKTMQVAQQLYEGVSLGTHRVGLITYMRTDSVRVSEAAVKEVRAWIATHFSDALPGTPNRYAAKGKSQDAHEAIRPTYVAHTPERIKAHLTRDQIRLYTLIWERFVASQMTDARVRSLTFEITAGPAVFSATETQVIEQGFYRVLKMLSPKDLSKAVLPPTKEGEVVALHNVQSVQHFTQGPVRYTDASIVKMLEEKGIGRPSTYAPTISVLLDRYYVTRIQKQLMPTPLGKVISDLLTTYFHDVVDVSFTARMESKLDEVEEDKIKWNCVIADFYPAFSEKVSTVMKDLNSMRGVFDEKTDVVCSQCGDTMVKKLGRFGFFLACGKFPECRNTQPVPLAKCPRPACDGNIVGKKNKGKKGILWLHAFPCLRFCHSL